ncbi:MAG: hypothetical protein Q9161_000034 [Pseudevernia consocians]
MTTSTTLPQTYIHSTPLATLAPHLLPHLPSSLPLLRRLQFHTTSPSARILATLPPSTTAAPPTSSFAATWADRTRAPETECWIFSTFETLPPLPPPTPSQHQEAKAQCLALLAGIARLPATTPLTVIGSVNESLLRLIGGDDVGDMVPQSVVSRDLKHNDDDDDGTGTGTGMKGVNVIDNVSVPYCKWLIAPPRRVESGGGGRLPKEENGRKSSVLPPGYYAFSNPRRDELKLTMSRTRIPKTEDTLAQLGSVGVRYWSDSTSTSTSTATSTSIPTATSTPTTPAATAGDAAPGELIAWAFLGVDGSLTSLHVEPEHRGRGLAKAVSRRLFQCLADDAAAMGFRAVGDGEYDGGDGWAHSDVAEENVESAGVARGLGGKEGWRVRWVSVNLAAVREDGGN